MMRLNTINTLDLLRVEAIYGRAEGAQPAGMFTIGDHPEMLPGSRTLTIDGQPVAAIWNELVARLAAFNQLADEKVAMLSAPVAGPTEKIGVPKNPGFQAATELGKPTKIRVEMISRGFPLNHFDLGYGYTQEYLDYATTAQILAVEAEVRSAWSMLRRNKMLEALFDKTNATQEALTIYRLYNADGEVPPKYKRWSHNSSHTHYLFDAGASPTETILDTMEEHLLHHGFGDFGETLYLMSNRADIDTIQGLTDFVPAASSFRPAVISGPIVGGRAAAAPSAALPIQGYHHRLAVVEDNDVPSGYLLAVASGGAFAGRNPVGERQHENPSARGLRLVQGPQGDYPLKDAVYDGYVGFGIRQRGAAVALMLNSGAAYTTPSFEDVV
jgi:hypothetical protein